MNPICILDLLAFLSAIAALVAIIRGWDRALLRDTKLFLTGLIIFILFHAFSNLLEWSGITDALDTAEDFIQALVPMLWAFIFYAFLKEMTTGAIRQSEKRAREQLDELDHLYSTSPVGLCMMDRDLRFLRINEMMAAMNGRPVRKHIGLSIKEVIPEIAECLEPVYREVIDSGRPVLNFEVRGVTPAHPGATRDWLVSSYPLKSEDGSVRGVSSVAQDITVRKRAEESLKESEEQYRDLFDNADELIQSVVPDGRILKVNKKWMETLCYQENEIQGLVLWDIIHPDSISHCKEVFQRVFVGETVRNIETVFLSKDGQAVPVEGTASCRIEEGKPVLMRCIFRDITDRKRAKEDKKRLEAQVFQGQRMEAIGTLAGGIAHDFNNLLMGIQGNASLMLFDIGSTHQFYAKLKNIEQYVQNGADLTKQLLGFARGGKYEVKTTELNELIRKSSEMFGRTRKEIRVHTRYEREIWAVEVDQGQIEQVMLNLYVNAWQAMPGGGELFLETKNVALNEHDVRPYQLDPGKYVQISVADTGMGMDEETLQRIFDPFFTTKEMGRGAGLGLASAYGIIKNHNGMINVYSEKGEGTTFHIFLPVSAGDLGDEKGLSGKVLRGTEKILFVDDEEMIIEIGRELMGALGYDVIIAKGGKEAIEIYRERGDEIDMVILDMIMPDLGGGEAYDQLKEIKPNVKVLLSSGYSIDGQATEILKRGCSGFIQKPFNIMELSHKIREILEPA